MSKLRRGKNLVELCNQNQSTSTSQICSPDQTKTTPPKPKQYKELVPYSKEPIKPQSPNYDNSIWMQPYSLTTAVFQKFDEYQTSDASSRDKVLATFKEKELNETKRAIDNDNVTFEDFDSDDSILDKNYVPSLSSSDSESDSNPRPRKKVSQPEVKQHCQVESLITLCEKSLSEQKNRDENKKDTSCARTEEEEIIVFIEEVSENMEIEETVREKEQQKPPTNETQTEEVQNASNQNIQQYTKSGKLRKRKKYENSLQERKEAQMLKIREQHNVKEGCNEKCRAKCTTQVTENERKYINKTFWDLTWKEKRIFIRNCASLATPKRKITSSPKRRAKRTFFFNLSDGMKVNVCKIFFLTTLGFMPSNDKVLYNALNEDENIGDRRGKHPNKTFIDRDVIIQHIDSYNPTISHYRREHAPLRKYLPSDVTVKMMYEDFCEKHPGVKISYDLYRKQIKSLNISFAQLGNEECESCEAQKIHCKIEDHDLKTPPDDCQKCKDFGDHKLRANKARMLYAQHKEQTDNDRGHIYFSADLEKVIMLPRLDTFKEVVFCPRLVAYNQTFAPLGKSKHHPYAVLWHEATAGRKQQDIISAFKAFFNQYRDCEVIDIWLDNCSAQNKNWLLYFYLVDLINSNEICAKQISLNYFEKGHTFMSCDHFHHQVELSMKRKGKIYDFSDFVDTVSSANSGKVTVKEMEVTHFVDICDFTSLRRLQTSTPRVYMKNIVQVMFKRENLNMFYKTDFDGEFIELRFLKETYLRSRRELTVITPRTTERGIKSSRKESILSKLGKLMPPHKLRFWEEIVTNDIGDSTDNI